MNLRASQHPKGRSTSPRTSHCRLHWERSCKGAGRAEGKQETALTGLLSTRYNNELGDTARSVMRTGRHEGSCSKLP
jgi:hypothetical protein